MSRAIYTLEIEDFYERGEEGYRVTLYDNGKEIGDGVAGTLRPSVIEALEQAGIFNNETTGE